MPSEKKMKNRRRKTKPKTEKKNTSMNACVFIYAQYALWMDRASFRYESGCERARAHRSAGRESRGPFGADTRCSCDQIKNLIFFFFFFFVRSTFLVSLIMVIVLNNVRMLLYAKSKWSLIDDFSDENFSPHFSVFIVFSLAHCPKRLFEVYRGRGVHGGHTNAKSNENANTFYINSIGFGAVMTNGQLIWVMICPELGDARCRLEPKWTTKCGWKRRHGVDATVAVHQMMNTFAIRYA